MGKCTERLYNGIVKENPTFVQMLGMCPTLAVTSSAINGAGMGLATTCILILSNAVISMLRKVIPDKVRIPSYIVIIASFVTVIQFLMEAYLPSLNSSLGIYIPLIVVNCIILGRAEAYASKNKVLPSIFDGIGMGLGFTIGLTVIGAFRELIGKGSIFKVQLLGSGNVFQEMGGAGKVIGDILGAYTPITIFVLAPGAFFVLAFLIAFLNKRNMKKAANTDNPEDAVTCKPESCASCTNMMCGGKLFAADKTAVKSVPNEENIVGTENTAQGDKTDNQERKIIIPDKIARKPVAHMNNIQENKEKAVTDNQKQNAEGPNEEHVENSDNVNSGQADRVSDSMNSADNVADTTKDTVSNEEHNSSTDNESNDVSDDMPVDKASNSSEAEAGEDKSDIVDTEKLKRPEAADEVKQYEEFSSAQEKKQPKKKKKKGGKK
jgi:electron transport complex protein RnfE